MRKWIKPSQLPNDFWDEVFVMLKSQYTEMRSEVANIKMVKKEEGNVKVYSEATNSWWKMDDKSYRIMFIERPEQDWSVFE